MSKMPMFELPNSRFVQILGADAEKVINNLCTNDIKKLAVNACCEAFITNVRGWCVEHGFVLKTEGKIELVGQFGNPQTLCAHIDRYIVREDAKITDLSDAKAVFVLSEAESERLASHFGATWVPPKEWSIQQIELDAFTVTLASVRLFCDNDVLLIAEQRAADTVRHAMLSSGLAIGSAEDFERKRICSFWPLSGREILEKSIPQELDRDRSAISFTKGCYLGQETIARLDAIGQLQKKLCAVQVNTGDLIEPGAALMKADQSVGQVTSAVIAADGSHVQALAYLRRGNFEPGLQLTCNGSSAIVLQNDGCTRQEQPTEL